MATKDYSTAQEIYISKYLGWKRTAASGAKEFNKGDLQSPFWIGECKTHTSKKDICRVYKSVFIKLVNESMSVHKYPVLFFDNGTNLNSIRSADDIFCIIPKNVIDTSSIYKFPYSSIKINKASISFNYVELRRIMTNKLYEFPLLDSMSLCICNLSKFKELIGG